MTQIRESTQHSETAAWHALPAEDSLQRLDSRTQGLAAEDAAQRLAEHGPNRLPPPARRSALLRFLLQFHNLLIYILLAAGVITALLGHWVDSGVIFGVVVINATVGFVQEGKAEQAMDAIRHMLSLHAAVLRDGQLREIPAEELVPGDVVQLAAGDKVPADLRLLRVRELNIDEAALTGESVPVEKTTAAVAADAVLGDRAGMAYSGTLVTAGQGLGLVVATGGATEIGRISALIAQVETLTTPLLRQIAHFGQQLTGVILLLAGFTFAWGVWLQDQTLADMFLAAVALAVAAIPEGLPAVITITLAIGVQRMAARNVIIRRLPAVETLGSVSVICSDKTGTLTRNEMTVRTAVTHAGPIDVSGGGYTPHGLFTRAGDPVEPREDAVLEELLRAGLLCNDAALEERDGRWHAHGDPMEAALIAAACKAGLKREHQEAEYPRADAIPFDARHRFMATLHHDHAGHAFVYLKGAPETVLDKCSHARTAGEDRPLDPVWWHAQAEQLAARGRRVLALAFRALPGQPQGLRFEDVEGGLTLLGLVGLVDPPRDEAIQAIAQCRSAGIAVKMITGDHAVTAAAIGKELGIGNGTDALSGHEIETLDAAALRDVVRATEVFARASPEHKLRLMEALQANGQVTAMTGDGVNDAPALKRADIGVAMGVKGTEAAKEAAGMVLTDDNFASIVAGVEEGRTVYDNIRKAILFILPTNAAQAMVITFAVLLGQVLPMTPVQILWVNMVTAVTLALALAFEPAEPGLMERPPRRADEPLLSGLLLWRLVLVSALLVGMSYGMFLWLLDQGAGLNAARTAAVNALVAGEIVYLFNSRYLRASSLNLRALFGSRYVLITVALVSGLQLLFTYAGFMQTLFQTAALDAITWLQMAVLALAAFLLVELEKAWLRGHDSSER
ncbi:MAG TPA: cation-transporting P-type ATPase [Gammaproteobacteria bacterium]